MTYPLGSASTPISRRLFDAAKVTALMTPRSLQHANGTATTLFQPVLSRLQAEASIHFGTPDVRLIPLVHEERPFSHIMRVAVWRNSLAGPNLHVFIKIFKAATPGSVETIRTRVARDFDVNRKVSEALARYEHFGVVRPIACYVEHLAIVTEQAEGETLAAHIESRARWFPRRATCEQLATTLATVGQWLRAFQAIDSGANQVSLPDVREYVDVRLRRLTDHHVLSAMERQRILNHLSALAGQVPSAELAEVLVHADFALGNILVCRGRVVVLDLAMTHRGSTLHDISRLYLQLDALRAKPQFRRGVVELLQNALLRGFDETLTPARPLFRYLLMLHRINHLGTLALNSEPFPARALSSRIRRIHRRWIGRELQSGPSSRR